MRGHEPSEVAVYHLRPAVFQTAHSWIAFQSVGARCGPTKDPAWLAHVPVSVTRDN